MPPLYWTLLILGYLIMMLALVRCQRQVKRFRKAAVRLDQLPLAILRLEINPIQTEKYLAGGDKELIRLINKDPKIAKELLELSSFRSINPMARKHWQGNLPLSQLLAEDQLAQLIENTSQNSQQPLQCLFPSEEKNQPPQLAWLFISNLHPNRHPTAVVVPISVPVNDKNTYIAESA